MKIRERVLREEHPDMQASVFNLAATYTEQRRWKEAGELQNKVVQAQKRVLVDGHADTLISMGSMASMRMNRNPGRWKEAEELFVCVVHELRKVLGNQRPSTMTSMRGLAGIHRNQGRQKEPKELDLQVMEIMKTK
jgi:hypothetical protein